MNFKLEDSTRGFILMVYSGSIHEIVIPIYPTPSATHLGGFQKFLIRADCWSNYDGSNAEFADTVVRLEK